MANINLSLSRITALLEFLETPFKDLNIIHIAGTNGKGSVCAFMASVLISCGYKTGQFNSPYFLDPSDSILINGRVSSEYHHVYQKVSEISDSQNFNCSSFEILTATAFMIFKMENVDIVLLEVGMGGRLDATNVINPPKIAIITNISLDHVEYLGDNIQDITKEKCGIIKNGVDSVIVSSQDFDQVYKVVDSFTKNCKVFKVDLKSVNTDNNYITVKYFKETCNLPVKLNGAHQINNACTALLALSRLEIIDSRFSFKPEKIRLGMESVRWPGRLEKLNYKNKDIFIDGAHNVGGAQKLKDFLKEKFQYSVTWILGFSQNKDIKGILEILLEDGDTIIAMGFESPVNMPWVKCMDPDIILQIAKNMKLNIQYFKSKTLDEALEYIDPKSTILVCGSLYLVSQVYQKLT